MERGKVIICGFHEGVSVPEKLREIPVKETIHHSWYQSIRKPGEARMATAISMEDLSKHIRKIDFCMMCTQREDGFIATRPMSNNGDVDYVGDSWFFSYDDTSKISQISRNRNVTLTFTAPPSLLGKPGIFIAIVGTAEIIRDRARFDEHWTSDLDRWFPEGTQTPGLTLLKVSASAIHYWDGEDNGVIKPDEA